VELAREEDVTFVSRSALTLCSRTHIYESRTHMDQSRYDVMSGKWSWRGRRMSRSSFPPH